MLNEKMSIKVAVSAFKAPQSVTLDDLELSLRTLLHYGCVFGVHYQILNLIGLI